MDNKSSMSRVERLHREKVTRYSIRKYSFGAASVAVAALFMFLGNGAVSANELSKQDTPSVEAPAPASEDKPNSVESTPTVQAISEESTAKPAEAVTPALNKTQLESYISEIETKLSNGSYDNKTEESVAELKADLVAAKTTLVNATTQDELTKAYRKLFTTVNSKLKNKPVEKKETPVVDTTNGKETVGKKAENTEKKSESNSIENTGSHDSRNRQAIPTGIQFRAEVAYSEGTNAEPNGHSDTYILNDVNRNTSEKAATDIVSRVTDYKVKYHKDANGKITSLDWLVYFNNYSENLPNKYNTDAGELYRNYIQIPKEVNMPDTITRAQYASPRNPKFFPGERLPRRYEPNGQPVSASATFDNPTPDFASGLPREGLDTFNLADWPDGGKGRSVENLSTQLPRYFKDAASDDSPTTRDILRAAAINGDRLIVDRSTTGGSSYNSYVWSFTTTVPIDTTNEQLKDMKVVFGMMRSATAGANAAFANVAANPVKMWQSDVSPEPTAKVQTVKAGQVPDAKKSIGNLNDLPQGTTVAYKEEVDTQNPGEKQVTAVVTYPDTSTKEVPVKVIVEKEAITKPVINTDLTGKAKTKTPVEVTADARTTVELFDKDGNSLGTGVANDQGVASITPTKDIVAGPVTAKATKNGKTSEVSDRKVATPVVPEKAIAQPTKEGDKSVTVAVPAAKPDNVYVTIQGKATNLRLQEDGTYAFVKNDANATVVNNPDGSLTFTLPEGKTLNAGDRIVTRTQNDDPSKSVGSVASAEDQTYPQLNQPEKVTVANVSSLTEDEKTAVKAAVKKANPSVVESELTVDNQGNVTYKHKGAGVNVASEIATLTLTNTVQVATTPTKPVINTDLTGKAKTKTPVEVTSDPGTTVELFDKDGNSLGTGVANDQGVASITPTKDIVAGPVTAKATKNGKTSEVSDRKVATPVVPEKAIAQPTKEGDKSVTVAVPAAKPDNVYVTIQGKATNLRLQEDGTYAFVKNDANATVVNNPDGSLTFTLPEGKTLNAGDRIVTRTQNDDPSKSVGSVASAEDQTYPQLNQPEKVTVANVSSLTEDEKTAVKAAVKKANPSVVESELTVDNQGNVTYKHKGAGVNVASEIATLTLTNTVQVATTPTKPVINTDLTGKAKTKTPVEVTSDPGTTVELFDKDGNSLGTGVANDQGVASITPTKDIVAGPVTAKATKNGKTSEVSDRKVATPVVPEKAIAQPTKEGDKSVTVAVPAAKPDNVYVTIQGKATNLRLQEDGTYAFVKNDANATVVNNPDGSLTLTLPEGKTLNAGDRIVTRTQNDDPSKSVGSVASAEDQTYPQLNQPKKVTVVDPTNLTEDEKTAVKAAVKKANPSVVESELTVDNQGNVTYKHKGAGVNVASEIATLTLTNTVVVAPTVELPYSNVDKRQIYIYTGEKTDLTFIGKDETRVKDLYLRNKGLDESDNASVYGFTIGKVTDSAVASGEGTVSDDKKTATIKMVGVTNLRAGQKWTSFIEAKDDDGVKSMPANEAYNVENDYELRRRKLGYVEFIVKSQTDKYDIKTPTEKVAVTDPANVTEADLAKVKEKLQLEYNQDNDDANIAKDTAVDKNGKIQSVTKDGNNLVVTYTDGSTDTKPLSEFVTLDKEPAIDAVKKAAEAKIAEINKTPNATDDEKQAAIDKVNADKKKALDEIAKPEVTTKDALDKAKTAGTDAIAKDNPVVAKKDAAKKAIEDALKAKEAAIDARTDLTDDDKKAAKDAAKAAADKAKAAVDAATKDAAVDKAKEDGTTAVANVTPVAKAEAKKAIAKALEDKNSEIAKRTDLTDEEKTAAKKEAKDKADAQLAKINEQPDAAATPTAAKTAQDAVDAAKKTGVAEVTAVNPVAVKKPAAKKAIDDALKAKEDAIDARPDLTDDEKKAAKDAAKAAAAKAKPAVDAATTDAAVDTAKGTGTGDIAKVNPVAKEAAKKAVADELAEKEKAIDARTDLTDEEKDAAKKDAQAKAKEATDAINAQPSNAETPEKAAEAQKAVDGAKDKGVADVKAVNPEAVTKPAAKKAIEDKLAKQLEEIANTPDATDEEKKVAEDAAKAAAEKAKEEIDKAETDAAVEAKKDEAVGKDGAKGTIDKLPVVEDKPNARKAIEDEAKAKKEAIDARQDLTPEAKAKLKAKVDKIAEKAKEGIDAVTSKTDVDVIKEADTAAIKAVGEINRPIDKVLVKDPSALTDEEKAKILEEVKKVNPTAKEVKYDENGNIEVTTEAGDKGIINPTKLVKTEDQLDNGKGGNDINKPLDKVIVKDPSNLTDEEKAKIVAKVEEVNPGAIVTIDENGTVSVSTPDGKTAAIPASDLVRTKEDTAKPDAGNSKIVKPADKVVGEANDPDDQAKVEAKLRELNPETKSVKFDENGNATVTLNDGTTATIPSEDLFRSEADVTKPNAGNDIVKPADKTAVKDPANLTPEEKKAIEDKVKAVNPDATVVVDDKGNATVTTPEGKTAVIPAADLTKDPEAATKPNAGNDVVKPADKTEVANPDKLTDAEKKAIEDKVKAVNPGATVVVDDKGNATVTTPAGNTAVIPATDLTKDPEAATKPNAGNDIVKPADKTVVANPEKLTDAEKKAIEDKVKAVNPDATVVVDDKGNATVTTPAGNTAVIPAADLTKDPEAATKPNAGNDVVKPADKTEVANPEKLTDAEKKAIEDKVKAVNPDATVVVDDKGNATVTTPAGNTAVIPATDLTKDPEAATKPNAGNDVVKPADKTEVANPDKLTDAEKKAIEDKVKAVNPDATVVVDDKGNATVTTPAGNTAVIPAADLTKSSEDAAKPNAGNDVVKPADKTEVANPEKLTDAEKKAIEDKVKAVNPDATVVVDDKGNATVTTPAGNTAVIPAADLTKSSEDAAKPNAGNDVVKPADKTEVANPEKLTDAEKKAIEDKVKAVNPDATVVVDDKGNATVTTPAGNTAVIPATDLTKDPEAATKPNAGNDVVKPADKTEVANPDKLTDAEKKAIEDKVKAVNPGATVVVDDKGNATVTTPAGNTAVIPATDLTKDPEAATKPNAGNDVVKPADKTEVANPDKLTDAEKKAIEDKVKAVNPGATVVVDDKGNATVTTPAGNTAVIPATDLTKDPEAATKPNAGNDIVKPADKTVVANPEKLTDAEKKAIEDKVKAVNPDATVVVDDKGNATVTTPAGNTAVIPAADLTKDPEAATKPNAGNDVVKPADKTEVANPEKLTDAEKKAIEDKVKAVNPDATVVVDDKGNATVTTPAGNTAVIPATDLTKDPEAATKPNAGNDVVKPADKTEVANPDKLTDAEKKAIEDKVKAVNPGATVVVDDKGNATVTTPAGNTAVIPATDLTKDPEAATKPNAGNDIVKPADKTVVANPEKLTDAEKKAIEDKVKAVNPDATVVVDDKGNATVTTPAGNTAVIPAADLTKDPEAATKPNAGNDVVKPADKTEVANPEKLTDAEKKAIEDKVKAVNPDATVVVDDKGNATVTTPAGNTAVIPATDLTKDPEAATKPNAGNDVVKPADKTEVANPDKLTDAEKKAIEDKVKAVNPGATVVVDDKGNATVTTPAGNTAVIPATDLTKDPEAATKPNAGNDVVKPADKTEVANPEKLTDAEKKAIEDKVKAVNPDATVVVDDKGNATVTTPAGNTAVIPATDLTKDPEAATKPNAGNDVVKPADKTEVANPDKLTDAEKKAIEDKVKAVNPDATVVVDDKGNATVTTPAGNTAVIPATDLTKDPEAATKPNAGNDVVKPADKTEVANPEKLTDAEKKAIEDKVKAVNPDATVVVDDKGNATVTTPEGKTAVIPAADVTKSAADAGKANAGNAVNTPAAKVEVKDPAKLTDEEKAKVKEAIEAVNPGSKVVVDDKGNATVTTPEGNTVVIPAADVTKSAADAGKANAGNAVNTPATRVLVGDKAKLTTDEIEKVKESIKAVNPGATVVVDENGNATVTTPEGKTATIPAAQLVKDAKDVAAKNNGENINVDFEKEIVADFNNLTDAEKEAAKAKIKGANADVREVIFDKAGNATVITKDGKVYTIAAKDIFKQRLYVPSNGGGNNSDNGNGTSDNNGATNTDAKVDKAKLEGAIHQLDELIIKESAKLDAETAKEANALSADAKKVFANADASQAEVDAMVKRIEDFMAKVSPSTDHATPATAQVAANAGQTASAQANARKAAKELPNTGTADSTVAMVAAAASAVLGLGLAGRRRKEDEEA